MKDFWIRPYILGGEDPEEFGLKIEFFIFFPEIWSGRSLVPGDRD